MTSGEPFHSFALLDADGRLVDWDDGFATEWRFAAPFLKRGASYSEILEAALNDPTARKSIQDNYGTTDIDTLIRSRLDDFEGSRTREYRATGNRIIRVDEDHTASGGVRRLARDVTDEKSAADALFEVQQRLEAAEESDTGGVMTETRRNPNGSYVFPLVSEALRRLLDLPKDVVGKDPMIVYSRMITTAEEDTQRAVLMERSAQTLEICSLEYRIRDGKDRLRWLRQSTIPRREADGSIIFSGVIRDVTREKETEDEVEMLRSVAVRSSDSIAIFQSDDKPQRTTNIVYVNAKFTELFGWSSDEVVGQPIEYLEFNKLNAEVAEMMTAALIRNDGQPIEFESRDKHGNLFWVEARVATIQRFENGAFRWAVISRDIGERRQVQQELLHAKEAAEAGNRSKSNFLANMSHELRTPLNAIIGFTELIEHGVARSGWIPSYAEYLTDVSESGRHLLDLINSILDLSKIEAGSLELELGQVDLHELVQASLMLVSGMAQSGGITIATEFPAECPEIKGDFLKLKQVLLNILSNAVKFTPSGGHVTVHADFTEDSAVIAITDTGCGISEHDLERVMLPFVQAENSLSRRFPGSGLGLSIARELCTLHGGRLSIESVEGEGTTVRIILPR